LLSVTKEQKVRKEGDGRQD